MPHTPTIKQVEEAISVLVQSTHDKTGDLADLLEEEYEDFRDILHDLNRDIHRKARRMKKVGTKRVRETAENINEHVHKDPWPGIGITAGCAFIAGLLLGSCKNDKDD
jgi:ElaB/YqjD/DUF883 family membrane-anchored ribosome-binding protein